MKRIVALLVLSLGLSACAAMRPAGTVIPYAARDWRTVATEDDRERLRDWRDAFVNGLKAARAAGHASAIAREGALLELDSALPGGPIPNGNYRCRVIKLGAKSPGMLDYVAYPLLACRIRQEGDLQGFAKLTGSQRHVGLIFPGDAVRQVFLGTLVLGDERRAMQYGRDEERDVAGFVERIGPNRWRMLMPRPHFESQIDVMELVPIG
jgi:predicted small secreted protein